MYMLLNFRFTGITTHTSHMHLVFLCVFRILGLLNLCLRSGYEEKQQPKNKRTATTTFIESNSTANRLTLSSHTAMFLRCKSHSTCFIRDDRWAIRQVLPCSQPSPTQANITSKASQGILHKDTRWLRSSYWPESKVNSPELSSPLDRKPGHTDGWPANAEYFRVLYLLRALPLGLDTRGVLAWADKAGYTDGWIE